MPVHSAFLKYFDQVCRSGSIRLAARKLYVASSAINRQILKIEDELGIALFERSHKGLKLTPAGQLLADHISRTLADAKKTMAAISALRDGTGEIITIAGQESVITRFLPQALLALHANYPNIVTAFKTVNGSQLAGLLLAGGADIALMFDPEPNDNIACLAQCQLPVGAVMSPDHPLAHKPAIAMQDCIKYPLVLPDQTWPLRHRLDQVLTTIEEQPNVLTSSNSLHFMQAIIAQKQAIGFQSILGFEDKLNKAELIFVPWVEEQPQQQMLAICTPMTLVRTEAVRAVLKLLCQRLQDYAA